MKSLRQRRTERLEAAARRREENPLELEGKLQFAGDLLRNHVERGGKLPKHRNLCMMFWFFVFRVPARWAMETFMRTALAVLLLLALIGAVITMIVLVGIEIYSATPGEVGAVVAWIVGGISAVGLVVASAITSLYVGELALIKTRESAPWLLNNPFSKRDFFWSLDFGEDEDEEDDPYWKWFRLTFLTLVPVAMMLIYAVGHLLVLGAMWLIWGVGMALVNLIARTVASRPVQWFFTFRMGHDAIRPWTIAAVCGSLWVVVQSFSAEATGLAAVAFIQVFAYIVVIITAAIVLATFNQDRISYAINRLADRMENPPPPGRVRRTFSSIGQFFSLLWTIVRVKKWGICPFVSIPSDLLEPEQEDEGEVIAPAPA